MFCSNCGAEIPDGAQFCPKCGNRVATDNATTGASEADKVEVVEEVVTGESEPVVEPSVSEEAGSQAEASATTEAPKVDASFYGQSGSTNQTANPTQVTSGANRFLGDTSHINLLQIFAIIMMLLYAVYSIRSFWGGISGFFYGLFDLIRPSFYHYYAYEFSSIVNAILLLLNAAVGIVLTVLFYGIFRNWKQESSRKYFNVLLVASIGSAVIGLIRMIFEMVMDFLSYAHIYMRFIFPILGRPIVLAAAGILGYFFITKSMHADPVEGGFQPDQELKNVKQDTTELWSSLRETVQGEQTATTGTVYTAPNNTTATAASNDPFSPDFASANGFSSANAAQNTVVPPNGGYQNMNGGPLKTDRSIWLYIFLGIITCGIYSLYIMYTLERDINIACDGDGEHTTSFWAYLGLTIITCGIYRYYYLYKMGNRLQRNAPRYGLAFEENGTSVLMWSIFGIFLCGVGYYVAMNILLNNTNAICREFNAYNNL